MDTLPRAVLKIASLSFERLLSGFARSNAHDSDLVPPHSPLSFYIFLLYFFTLVNISKVKKVA